MADAFCEPFAPCPDIDGRLLVRQSIQGPTIAREEGALAMGALALRGAEIRPYLDLFFEQRWTVKEACYGPVRSVMGLAPGETVTIEITHREQVEISRLVQNSFDRRDEIRRERRTTSEFETQTPPPAGSGGGGGGGDDGFGLDDVGRAIVDPVGFVVDLFGSVGFGPARALAELGEAIGAVGGQIAHEGQKTAEQIGNMIGALVGSAGTRGLIERSLERVEEALERISVNESHHLTADRSTRTETSTQRIRRTFSNPYRDRSLELRFIPVFRRMEITTRLHRGILGLALNPGRLVFPRDDIAARFPDVLRRIGAQRALAGIAAAGIAAGAAAGGATAGIAAGAASGAAASGATAGRAASVAAVSRAASAAAASARAATSGLAAHLEANAAAYTPRALAALRDEGAQVSLHEPMVRMLLGKGAATRGADGFTAAHALDWSRALAEGGALKVPLGDPDAAGKGFKLTAAAAKNLAEAIGRLEPGRIGAFLPQPPKREIRLFMGTHIEAVAGTCVLADVPVPA